MHLNSRVTKNIVKQANKLLKTRWTSYFT